MTVSQAGHLTRVSLGVLICSMDVLVSLCEMECVTSLLQRVLLPLPRGRFLEEDGALPGKERPWISEESRPEGWGQGKRETFQ